MLPGFVFPLSLATAAGEQPVGAVDSVDLDRYGYGLSRLVPTRLERGDRP